MRFFESVSKLEPTSFKIRPVCTCCGRKFDVEVRNKDGRFLTTCYHSTIRQHYFMGWAYSLPLNFGTNKQIIHFKNRFYKIIGYTHIQREIVYWIWSLLWDRKTIDYWECPKCFNK